jgi:hypothetical protein
MLKYAGVCSSDHTDTVGRYIIAAKVYNSCHVYVCTHSVHRLPATACSCGALFAYLLSDVCSRMLTYAHVCSRMLTYAGVCWRTVAGAALSSPNFFLTYADVCSRMLTYAHVCWRMLAYAGVRWQLRRCRRLPSLGSSTRPRSEPSSRYMTYAHVCSRMLTYAHVCSRMLTASRYMTPRARSASRRMLTYAGVCSRMLTYAHVCSRDVCGSQAHDTTRMQHFNRTCAVVC